MGLNFRAFSVTEAGRSAQGQSVLPFAGGAWHSFRMGADHALEAVSSLQTATYLVSLSFPSMSVMTVKIRGSPVTIWKVKMTPMMALHTLTVQTITKINLATRRGLDVSMLPLPCARNWPLLRWSFRRTRSNFTLLPLIRIPKWDFIFPAHITDTVSMQCNG